MKKRILSLVLAICILFSLAATVSAATQPAPQYMPQAVTLNELGLLRGVGKNADGSIDYALPRSATRIEGLILLIRLLGEEEEALAYTGDCPFTDLSGSYARYAAYAREKGYTKGVSATRFDNSPLYANAFLTFVLRSLGYTEVNYRTAFVDAGQAGLIEQGEFTDQNSPILRDACVKICYNALMTEMADGSGTLLKALLRRGKVNGEPAAKLLAEAPAILPATSVDLMAWQKAYIGALDPQYKKQASYFGLPEDIGFLYDADCDAEFENNVLYAALMGDFALNFCFDSRAKTDAFGKWFESDFRPLCARHPDLLGVFCNQSCLLAINDPGGGCACCVLSVDPDTHPALTMEQIRQQQQESVREAEKIHAYLHEKGLVKSGMTRKQTAQAIGEYLLTLNVAIGDPVENQRLGQGMLFDNAYGCLIGRKADCVGRAAAFNLLCHMEGIPAEGVTGRVVGSKNLWHEVTMIPSDGGESYFDWYNRIPFVTEEQLSEIMTLEELR